MAKINQESVIDFTLGLPIDEMIVFYDKLTENVSNRIYIHKKHLTEQVGLYQETFDRITGQDNTIHND